METKTMDKISTAIERVVKDLKSGAVPMKKRMRLGEFVTFALTEIKKAAKDKPQVAKRRLLALKQNVDDVLAAIAKLDPEDVDSEDIDVEVTTAFAPTQADGDTPMEDLTTASDQSSSEISPLAVEQALGNTAFATNLDEVTKALKALKADLGLPAERARTPAKKIDGHRASDGQGDGGRARATDGWPLDLAADTFMKGDDAPETGPFWGYDPGGVASPKAR